MADKKKPATIDMDLNLTIENSRKIHGLLLDKIKKAKIVKMDISRVSKIDLSGFQLIVSAFREALSLKKEFLLTGKIREEMQGSIIATGVCTFPPQSGEVLSDIIKDLL